MKTLVVNLFGGPGTGKSTAMAGIFYGLKMQHVNCEQVPEYVKGLVWSNSTNRLADQVYLFGKQRHHLRRLLGKVDVIVTDAPLLQFVVYDNSEGDYHEGLIKAEAALVARDHDELNVFMERGPDLYQREGRLHTLDQATEIDAQCVRLLEESLRPWVRIPVADTVEVVKGKILEHLRSRSLKLTDAETEK